jgi:hypothetical protein
VTSGKTLLTSQYLIDTQILEGSFLRVTMHSIVPCTRYHTATEPYYDVFKLSK